MVQFLQCHFFLLAPPFPTPYLHLFILYFISPPPLLFIYCPISAQHYSGWCSNKTIKWHPGIISLASSSSKFHPLSVALPFSLVPTGSWHMELLSGTMQHLFIFPAKKSLGHCCFCQHQVPASLILWHLQYSFQVFLARWVGLLPAFFFTNSRCLNSQ